MFGEAVVFFKKELARNFQYVRKQGMQLNSKMRFMAAQFEALLSGDLWQRNARHTNALAKRLGEQLEQISAVKVTQRVEANGVFAELPAHVIAPMQELFPFYVWNEKTHEVRLMCSWDTTEEEVDSFVAQLKALL